MTDFRHQMERLLLRQFPPCAVCGRLHACDEEWLVQRGTEGLCHDCGGPLCPSHALRASRDTDFILCSDECRPPTGCIYCGSCHGEMVQLVHPTRYETVLSHPACIPAGYEKYILDDG